MDFGLAKATAPIAASSSSLTMTLSTYHFAMRSMASSGAFHVAYYYAPQQAFLEAHELAFGYFGGVFRRLRYDNLKSAVKKILRGHQREETERLIAFRSHWGFQTEFCNPARGNEKGGVEGEVGYSPPESSGAGSARRGFGGVERAVTAEFVTLVSLLAANLTSKYI
jgi:hypothetical protein